MYFLSSGEELTDIGTDKGAATICEGNDFVVGPMAMIVSKIVECKHDYSIFDGACVLFRKEMWRSEPLN